MPANEVVPDIATFSPDAGRANGFKPTASKTQIRIAWRAGILSILCGLTTAAVARAPGRAPTGALLRGAGEISEPTPILASNASQHGAFVYNCRLFGHRNIVREWRNW